ncbi:MAG: DUF4469 domain-containing protein [Parabacteroides sp.]|nr:DUF4469 domain-containing protein [Parabacteroides sp.]
MVTIAKVYKWLFDLEENSLTKDVKEDYTAKVKTIKSMNLTDIANEISLERTEYRPETIVNIGNLIDEKIRQLVCAGNTVTTGSAQYAPTITGVMIGNKGIIDPAVNKCIVNVIPSAAMRAEVAKVTPEFSGNVKDLGGARISLVKDVTTGRTDGFITIGGMLDISGIKIKSVNADGTGIGTVSLVGADNPEKAVSIQTLGINDPSRLMFTLPANLEQGDYTLQISTYFSNTSTLLKQSRLLTYPITLTTKSGAEDRPGEL